MKHIEIEANGYSFDVSIDEFTPLGEMALSIPIEDLMRALINTAKDANLNPSNINELNQGATAVSYALA